MRALDLLFAAAIVYLPYAEHYPVALPVRGANLVNGAFVLLVLVLAARHGRATPAPPLRGRFLALFGALAAGFTIASFDGSADLLADLEGLKNAVFYVLLFFLFYYAPRDERSIRLMYGALILVVFLVSLQGVRQALDYGIASFNPNRRITGPFGHGTVFGANMAAGFFIILLPVALVTAIGARRRPILVLASVACLALGMFATFYTYSRQAYLVLAVLFTLAAARRNLLLGVVMAACLFMYEMWLPDTVVERIDMTTQVAAGGEFTLDSSSESRFAIWEGAWKLIGNHPWGIGLGRFRSFIGSEAPQYAGFDAHNGFLLVATECGIAGLAALCWLLFGLWRLASRIERLGDRDSLLYGSALSIAVLGVVSSNLFGSRIFNGEVMADFWALAGLTARHYTLCAASGAALDLCRRGPPVLTTLNRPAGEDRPANVAACAICLVRTGVRAAPPLGTMVWEAPADSNMATRQHSLHGSSNRLTSNWPNHAMDEQDETFNVRHRGPAEAFRG